MRIAITMLAVYSVSIFFVGTWAGMAVFAVLLAVACAYLARHGLSIGRMLAVGVPVYVIAAITIVCNVFVWTGSAVEPSLDGLVRGLFFAVRMMLLVWASLAVCLSTDMSTLERAFASILAPLRLIRVPVDDVAMACSIAIRFIPLVFERFMAVKGAQWSRGARFDEGPLLGRLRSFGFVFAPMLIGLFRSADRLSLAMDARCYGAVPAGRTDLHRRPLPPAQIAAAALVGALCIACCVML